jgi:quinol monooxygenase YgiN
MENQKMIIMAEISILPEFLEEVKTLSAATLAPTLLESGCEVFYQTAKHNDPYSLVFFEVFKSQVAYDNHLEAQYTKKFFTGLQGKLAGKPVITNLDTLSEINK